MRVDHPQLKLDVQGRFEQVPRNIHGRVNATHLTSVVAASNNSVPVEVRHITSFIYFKIKINVSQSTVVIYTVVKVCQGCEIVRKSYRGPGIRAFEGTRESFSQ